MGRTVKAAVIGTGHLGKHHARILSGMPGVELVGVADSVPAVARQVAEQHHTRAFDRPQDLIGLVDAAVIAVPTRLHYKVGMELLQHGIHLLVEKPLAPTFIEAWQMAEAAGRRGLVLAVGHVERFNPAWQAVRRHGSRPKFIEANRLGAYTCRSTDIGVVLDLMIHDLDLILSLVQQPVERIEALGMSIFGGHEDVANARLTFAGGCVATVNASRASFVARRDVQVWTPTGYVAADFASRTAKLVQASDEILERKIDIDSLSFEQKDEFRRQVFTDHLRLEQITPDPCDQLTVELEDFIASVRDKRAPRCEGREACTAIAVAERILAKIQTHAWEGNVGGPRGPLAQFPLPGSPLPRQAVPHAA